MSSPGQKNIEEQKVYGLTVRLKDAEFENISEFIERKTGIKLGQSKKVLVEGRLQKIIRHKGFDSFTPYIQQVIGKHADPKETVHFIDVLTTNKTDFFRESDHFDYLKDTLFKKSQSQHINGTYRVWSAACSTGEEPYTLSMTLHEQKLKGIISDYEVLGTDISHRALQKANNAEYDVSRIYPIPDILKRKYLLRHKDPQMQQVRIAKNVRDRVSFQKFNLIESDWNDGKLFDAIFCRNVFIYFDRTTQEFVLNKLIRHLKHDGLIFLGHSETLNGITVPLKSVANAVYKLI